MEKATVLIIDDEAPVRRLIAKVLAREGYDVLTAADGEEAVDIVNKNKIDLALVDLKMPGMGGIETIREIKKVNAAVAFIIITAFAELSSLKDAVELGVFDYITKPFDLEYLKHLVRHMMAGIRPRIFPYFENIKQVFDGKLELGELKKMKVSAFKEDIRKRMTVLKGADEYVDRAIFESYKSLFGLMKYRAKKIFGNVYIIVITLGIIVGSTYGYIYGSLSTRALYESISKKPDAGKELIGMGDFYNVLKELTKWMKIHTLDGKKSSDDTGDKQDIDIEMIK